MAGSQPQSEMLDESAQECPLPRTSEAVDCWLRKWGRDAVADGKEPLTRQDVERLIKANGGTAEGLHLYDRDLRGTNLVMINLQGVLLMDAKLQCTPLWWSDLRGANLSGSNLQGADLHVTSLQGADLTGMQISTTTNLGNVKWHQGYVLPSENRGEFNAAQSTYRDLKQWHQEHGFYDIAGEFHHREMVCRRKQALWEFVESFPKSNNPWRLSKSLFRGRWSRLAAALVLAFYEQLFGYGERPWRVVRAAAIIVLGLALAYRYFGAFVQPVRFIDALYFSAVSFSALGYGSWATVPQGWAKYMGAAESYLGVFTIALFLVTFTRKMVR